MFWNSTWQILIQRVVSNKPAEGVLVVVVVLLSTVHCNSVYTERQGAWLLHEDRWMYFLITEILVLGYVGE